MYTSHSISVVVANLLLLPPVDETVALPPADLQHGRGVQPKPMFKAN